MSAVDALVAVLLLAGAVLALLAGIGLLRFPDVFARMHAATKPAALGLLCVLVGTAVALQDATATAKLLLVAVFQFVTIPVGAHMIGRAAYRSGTEVHPDTVVDELAEAGVLPPREPGEAADEAEEG